MSQYEQLDTTARQKGGVLRSAAVLIESISKTVLAKNVELRRFERTAQ